MIANVKRRTDTMPRPYHKDRPSSLLSREGAFWLRQKILGYWHSKGFTDVEVYVKEVTTPVEHWVVRSNISELGLLKNGGVR
jgi:hypothetical protein